MHKVDVLNKKAIFLLGNGFCEREFVQAHKALEDVGVHCRIASDENAIIRGWNEMKSASDSNWGADYAPDVLLDTAHPSDYDILVIPGGIRSVEKLKHNKALHGFVSYFIQAGLPVIAYNNGIDLLSHLGFVEGYTLAATDMICDDAKNKGGVCAAPEFVVSKNIITLSRYREVDEKLQSAVQCIFNGERYADKIASSDNMPNAHKVA